LILAFTHNAQAQYAPPPPPPPFPGFINEALRKDNPDMNAWDFGGLLRLRYEAHEGFGIAGSPGSIDFRKEGADVSNHDLLSRLRLRSGYTGKWFSVLAEGRRRLATFDERVASAAPVRNKGDGPESDMVDLHQAYFILGNHKEFPLSLKLCPG
jgi:hypothetical protein